MSQPARRVWQLFVLQRWTTYWLGSLVICAVFALSGCGLRPPVNSEATINILNGIVALSASDAWAVGWASGRGSSPLTEHWDGHSWMLVSAPGKGDQSFLEGVAASSAQDVWAVGYVVHETGDETLIEHWNGTAWQVVASPNSPGYNMLRGVAVYSATDAWAVGTTIPCPPLQAVALHQQADVLARKRLMGGASDCTAVPRPPPRPLIEHWDGHAWSIVKSPIPDPNASHANLSTVVAFNTDDVWANGAYLDNSVTPADGSALIEHWDGTAWHIRTDFDTALESWTNVIAFVSSRDIWEAEFAPAPPNSPTIKHWDGSVWSVVPGPQRESGGYVIFTMAASAPDDLWAAGASTPAPQKNSQGGVFAMHWNGSSWRVIASPSSEKERSGSGRRRGQGDLVPQLL